MKVVPNYPNLSTNDACLQACVKNILSYFKLSDEINNVEIGTGYHNDSFSWITQAVSWLSSLGLDVCLYSPFKYDRLVKEGIDYMKEFKKQYFDMEFQRGDYKYLNEIIIGVSKMIDSGLWINESIPTDTLVHKLRNENTLAIGKTIYEWMSGSYIAGTSHYVTMIKEYSPTEWLINDPGLPPVERRKISKWINNHDIVGEVLLIRSNQ